jgi:tRNA pseudouridine-54 N-methylase
MPPLAAGQHGLWDLLDRTHSSPLIVSQILRSDVDDIVLVNEAHTGRHL